ncbi:hypothetical protein Tco_0178353 [Tanacetum coccineum]
MKDDKETDEHEEIKEDDEAEIKKHIEIVQDKEEITIDAIPLATKPLMIVEYKIVKEGQKGFYHLIRADGSSKRYSSMIKMLQNIDREDLETLWNLVKDKHENTRPEDDYKRVIWGDLKVMFEPDIKNEVWRSLQGYKVTVWKLFDNCGVHFVRLRDEAVYFHLIYFCHQSDSPVKVIEQPMARSGIGLEDVQTCYHSNSMFSSVSTSTHPIIIISDSNVEDAFSSTNTPDYTLASPDYFPASPGNTSFDPLEDLSKDLLASLAISPFHDDLYMKEILPPQKRARFLSPFSTNSSAPPQRDFDRLETELQEARTQISGFQREQIRHDEEIVLARVRISTLEMLIEDIQVTMALLPPGFLKPLYPDIIDMINDQDIEHMILPTPPPD